MPRIYGYEKTLFDFDSKFVTQPGNKLAAAFLFDRYKSLGYEPEYQRFEYGCAPANPARLRTSWRH